MYEYELPKLNAGGGFVSTISGTWVPEKVTKRTTTREYDEQGRVVKEVVVEEYTGGYYYNQPYYPVTVTGGGYSGGIQTNTVKSAIDKTDC